MLTRFIHWKKNITPYACHSLSITFSRKHHYLESLQKRILPLLDHLDDDALLAEIKRKGLMVEQDEFEKRWSVELEPIFPAPSVRVVPRLVLSDVQMDFQLMDRLQFGITTSRIPKPFVASLLTIPGVEVGMFDNPHYRGWENNNTPGTYHYRRGIKLVYDKKLDYEVVDLSDRPGRSASLERLRFVGASDYWFGSAIFEVFPREHLLAFKQALRIQELPNGIIHLQLLHLDEYWSDDSQARIRALREHLEIDRLEGEYRKAVRDLWIQRHGKPGKLSG